MLTRIFRNKPVLPGFLSVLALLGFIYSGPINAASTGSFVENQGQLKNESVKFYLKGSGYGFYFAEGGVLMDLYRLKKDEQAPRARRTALSKRSVSKKEGVVIKSTFVGAQTPTIMGKKEKVGKVSYFVGKQEDWKTKIPTYGEVLYKDLYPNIDLRYISTTKGIKYQFEVHPGGDPKAIKIALSGQDTLSIDSEGNLVMHTRLGEFKDVKPFTFQRAGGKQVPVSSDFVIIDKNDYGFKLATYDPGRTLIIDPGVVYGTLVGGAGADDLGDGKHLAVDLQGSLIVNGSPSSACAGFQATPGAYDTVCDSTDDFVAKLSADGSQLLAATFFAGTGLMVSVDDNSNIYLTGFVDQPNLPTTSGAFDTSCGSDGICDEYVLTDADGNPLLDANGDPIMKTQRDGFIAKFSPDLQTLLYGSYVGGAQWDVGVGIISDPSGNIWVSGDTSSNDFPITPTTYSSNLRGSGDAFFLKLSPGGQGANDLLYSTFLGGDGGEDLSYGMGLDPMGRPFVAGHTSSVDDPGTPEDEGFPTTANADPNLSQPCTLQGYNTGFAAKLNSSGTDLVYGTLVKCPKFIWEMGGDPTGASYLTGFVSTDQFYTTPGAFDEVKTGTGESPFAIKLDTEGNLVYSTLLEGDRDPADHGHGIAGDNLGRAVISGVTGNLPSDPLELLFPTTEDAYSRVPLCAPSINPDCIGELQDEAYVAVLSPDGSEMVYGTRLGPMSPSPEEAMSVTVDSAGNIFVGGFTRGEDFRPLTPGSLNHVSNSKDVFAVRIDNPDTQAWANRFNGSGSGNDEPRDIQVDSSGNVYVLSDSDNGQNKDYLVVKYDSQGTIECEARYDNPGDNFDLPGGMAVDGAQNIYVTGASHNGSDYDYATVKFDSSCNQVWEARLDLGPDDEANALAIDSSGNIYVTGMSNNGSDDDIVTVKYDADGNEDWKKPLRYDGGSYDAGREIALDSGGNIYVSGEGGGPGSDLVTIKYNNQGREQWVAPAGPGFSGGVSGIAVDGSGNVYLTGTLSNGSNQDIMVFKFDSNGNAVWERSYDNLGTDWSRGLSLDADGNVYVGGQSHNGLNFDFVALKLDSSGNLQWDVLYDERKSDEEVRGFVGDSSGNTYLTGYSWNGWSDDFLTVSLDSEGKHRWMARYDSFESEGGIKITPDNSGNVYVLGRTGTHPNIDMITIKYTPAPVSSPPPPPPGGDVGMTVSDIRTGVAGKGAFTEISTFAQGDTVTFRTTVVDENGQPVACDSAEITITGPETNVVSNGPCDGNGVVDVDWKTAAPKKSNPGTPTGSYTATATNVTATGFVFDGISPTVNFSITP